MALLPHPNQIPQNKSAIHHGPTTSAANHNDMIHKKVPYSVLRQFQAQTASSRAESLRPASVTTIYFICCTYTAESFRLPVIDRYRHGRVELTMPEVKHPGNPEPYVGRGRERTRDSTRKRMMTPDEDDDDGRVMIIVAVGTRVRFC